MRHHRPNHWQIRKISIFYDVFTVSIPNTEHISHIVTHLSSEYLHVTFSILVIQIIFKYFYGDDLNIFFIPIYKDFFSSGFRICFRVSISVQYEEKNDLSTTFQFKCHSLHKKLFDWVDIFADLFIKILQELRLSSKESLLRRQIV